MFLTQKTLWRLILIAKYIDPLSVVDWIRQRNKPTPNVSTQWKALSHAFSVIGNYLALKVENGAQVRIGYDAIMGCGERIFLAEALTNSLRLKCFCTLDHCYT
jgi:hypothetical protein